MLTRMSMNPTDEQRLSWDEMFLHIAETLAGRSTCSRRHVGAVFVRDNRYLSGGYNGAASGERHCNHGPCHGERHIGEYYTKRYDTGMCTSEHDVEYGADKRPHCSVAIHAEMNAILDAALRGVSIQGATLYVTHPPCVQCEKHLKQLKLERVVCQKV